MEKNFFLLTYCPLKRIFFKEENFTQIFFHMILSPPTFEYVYITMERQYLGIGFCGHT